MKALLMSLALLCGACGGPEPAIGVLLPTTGPAAELGEEAMAGLMLAVNELPPGSRPPLIFADSGGTPAMTTLVGWESWDGM